MEPFKAEELGTIWLPKNKYRPGDTIKGYIFLRKKPIKGSNVLELMKTDEKNAVILELIDTDKNTVKVIPIIKLDEPIIYFEVKIGKYLVTGDYSFQLKKGKKTIHTIPFNVGHYDKPDIEVFINLPKWSLVGKDVKCNIQSKYYHGEPVTAGKVILSADGFEKDIDAKFSNGSIDITLPDLLPGNHSITAVVEDENDRKATSVSQINIVEEPLQIQISKNPSSKPLIEDQQVDVNIKVVNPINLPISNKKVQCKILNEKQEKILDQEEFFTDIHGFVTIPPLKFKQGSYLLTVLVQTDTGQFVSLTDQFLVRKPTEEDIWIQFTDIPNAVNPGDIIKGNLILKGPGIAKIITKEVYLDVISDRILDTKKFELTDIKLNEISIPITVDVPNGYYGDLEIEGYLNPIESESFEQKIETTPNSWYGETFSFPKTSVMKKIEIITESKTLNFNIDSIEEVATGTNFDIKVKFENNLSKDDNLWIGVALTDERVLLEYQPINPQSSFNIPTNAVEILTIGSKQDVQAFSQPVAFAPDMARPGGAMGTAAGATRKMMKMRGGRRMKASEGATLGAGFDQEDFSEGFLYGSSVIMDKVLETPVVQQVIRTEFPEDIVNKPEKVSGDHKFEIKSPDSITRYKIFVIACNETHFGVEERSIVVKNPIFTSTLNPSDMTLGDRITLPTVLENLSNEILKDITISINSNENLKIHSNLIQKLKELKANEKVNVYWDIEASKVGDVDLSTLLESKYFTEYSELQTPLYISPPGIPHPELFRSKLQANKPWIQELEITGEEAFTLGIVNFLPGVELAAIEGVESLAAYPYGCCEQTSASTIPNAIAYRYLESNDKLTDDIKKNLITNMQAGLDRYTSKFLNEKEGGFGLWDGNNPSVFHTSLAISVIGKISPFVNVPDDIFTGARDFLSSKQNEDGSYESSKGVHQNFPATLSNLSMTAYVAHSQALGGVTDQPAIEWLLKQIETEDLKSDPTVIALLLDSIAMLKDKLPKEIVDKIPKVTELLLTNIEENDKGSYWSKGSALSSEVETTSYALAALAHTENYPAEILNIFETGANFLLNTRSSSGWFTTRDTLWATLALGEIASKMEQNAVNGTLNVKLNGEVIASEFINKENKYYKIYDVRNIFLDKFTTGSNKVEVFLEGEGTGHIALEIRKWYSEKAKKALPIDIKQELLEKISQEENFSISYTLNSDSPLEAVMLEQPIPTGCELDKKTLDDLRNIPGVNHVEINNNLVSIFLTELKNVNLEYNFIPKMNGKIQVNGLRVMPMYQPETTTSYKTKWIEIRKNN